MRDIFETDLSRATVVAFYLLPEFNAKLMPKLLALKPGTRIVSHDGGIGDWPPDERLEMRAPEKPVGVGGLSRVELWIVPADARGSWPSEIAGARRALGVSRSGRSSRSSTSTRAARGATCWCATSRLRGTEIKMVVTGMVGTHAWHHLFEGRIDGDRIAGDAHRLRRQQREDAFPGRRQRAK